MRVINLVDSGFQISKSGMVISIAASWLPYLSANKWRPTSGKDRQCMPPSATRNIINISDDLHAQVLINCRLVINVPLTLRAQMDREGYNAYIKGQLVDSGRHQRRLPAVEVSRDEPRASVATATDDWVTSLNVTLCQLWWGKYVNGGFETRSKELPIGLPSGLTGGMVWEWIGLLAKDGCCFMGPCLD